MVKLNKSPTEKYNILTRLCKSTDVAESEDDVKYAKAKKSSAKKSVIAAQKSLKDASSGIKCNLVEKDKDVMLNIVNKKTDKLVEIVVSNNFKILKSPNAAENIYTEDYMIFMENSNDLGDATVNMTATNEVALNVMTHSISANVNTNAEGEIADDVSLFMGDHSNSLHYKLHDDMTMKNVMAPDIEQVVAVDRSTPTAACATVNSAFQTSTSAKPMGNPQGLFDPSKLSTRCTNNISSDGVSTETQQISNRGSSKLGQGHSGNEIQGIFETFANKVQANYPPRMSNIIDIEDVESFSTNGIVMPVTEAVEENTERLNAALVGRIIGRKVSYTTCSLEFKRLWSFADTFTLMYFTNGCFICIFSSTDARDAVLAKGPWFVSNQLLGLDKWSPDFDPITMDGLQTPIWIRFPNLPLLYWDKRNITRLATMIGVPLWYDEVVNEWGNISYARVCVKLNLANKLKAGIWIQGSKGKIFQLVIYEGLSKIYFNCGLIGHNVDVCLKSPQSQQNELILNSIIQKVANFEAATTNIVLKSTVLAPSKPKELATTAEDFGLLTMVIRKKQPRFNNSTNQKRQ